MSRDLRRHHRERMKAKARRLYPGQNPGRLADNLTPCSCFFCTGGDMKARKERKRYSDDLQPTYSGEWPPAR